MNGREKTMKIKDLFWKLKRATRRNRKAIRTGISVVLTVALVAVVGYAAFTIYKADVIKEANQVEGQDESPIKKQKANYGEAGWNQIAENDKYVLSADYTTGEISVLEKNTGKVWYSNPPERANDNLCALKTRINSQIHVDFLLTDECITTTFDNYGESIKKGGMTHELIENGIKFSFAFPTPGVIIPVQYTLCEDGLLAEIVTSEIQELWTERYIIQNIIFLPFFGAGGLEDEGYLMVPDGSGALIEFNNMKQTSQSYFGDVYGKNTINQDTTASTMVSEQVTMPVFGAKCNDSAFLGVIMNGDANSKIYASTSRKTSSYNQVYSSATIREYAIKHMEGRQSFGGGKNSRIYEASNNLLENENYSVKYFFLEPEKADYVGMSECYRDYLVENKELKASELADEKYLVLDILGAVSIEQYVFGVKTPVVTAMTTYNELCDIVKELKENGVENLIINYIGAYKGGLNAKSQDEMKVESTLGTKKEFNAMIEYLKSENVILFMQANPIDAYKSGNGYKNNRDTAKNFFNAYGFQYQYELDTYKSITKDTWRLMSPDLVADFTDTFATSLKNWDINNISVDRIGDALYSNYDKKNYISRTMTMGMWADVLKEASEKMDAVMIHDGNAYALPYVDIITDLSNSNSDFDMEDSSIPFYQIAFQNTKVLTSEGFNTTVDYRQAFLKALESGSSIKFNLFNTETTELVGTQHNDKTSYSYTFWKDTIIEMYKEYEEVMKNFAGEEILHHEILDKDVALTEYESGKIVINYSTEPYTYGDVTVEANGYAVLSGGAK